MVAEYLTCPLCGFEFEKQDTLCAHGCPLGALCNLLRCPSCEYEFPLRPPRVSWIRRLWGRPSRARQQLPQDILAIDDLGAGDGAIVMCVGGTVPDRRNAFAVFGLIPGAEATVLQQRPTCVIRIGETELALDREIAREILVRRAEPKPSVETHELAVRTDEHDRRPD